MSIISELAKAIARNPTINRVIVSSSEFEQIKIEFEDLIQNRLQYRPTYGAPFSDIDRELWDWIQYERRFTKIMIMGRPLEVRP